MRYIDECQCCEEPTDGYPLCDACMTLCQEGGCNAPMPRIFGVDVFIYDSGTRQLLPLCPKHAEAA
jgi:hypothetical protein